MNLSDLAVSGSHPDLVRPVPEDLKENAQELLDDYLRPLDRWARARGARVLIISGYRPAELNRAVGAGPTSRHRMAAAADVVLLDLSTGRQVPELLPFAFDYLRGRGPYGELELKTDGLHIAIPIPGRENNKALVDFDGDVSRLPDLEPSTMGAVALAFFGAVSLAAILRST